MGFPQEHYAGHSFQIGVATSACPAGIEDSDTRQTADHSIHAPFQQEDLADI